MKKPCNARRQEFKKLLPAGLRIDLILAETPLEQVYDRRQRASPELQFGESAITMIKD